MTARLLLLVLLLARLAAAPAQGTCSPPALGHPCATESVSALGLAEPEPSLGIGNPVHLATGNKHQQELDLPGNPAAPLLQVLRHYNSLDPRHGAFGRGWSTSYDTRIFQAGGRIQIVQADGSRIDFPRKPQAPLRNRHGLLQRDAAQWTWLWPDGRILRFDRHGRLTRITAPQRDPLHRDAFIAVDIVRHEQAGPLHGAIEKVVASRGPDRGAELLFDYRISGRRAYISAIQTPLGRFIYRYERVAGDAGLVAALRLVAVRRPDGFERRYLYEAERQSGMPQLVTGLVLVPPRRPNAIKADDLVDFPERIAQDGASSRRTQALPPGALRTHSWAYDAHARVVESALHHPSGQAYALRITYRRAASEQHTGLTLVDGADGRRTRFEFTSQAGRYALLAVDGAPCSGCAAPGMRATYDKEGRLQNINGARIGRNAAGGLSSLSPLAPGWPGLRFEFDEQGRRTSWHADATGAENALFDKARRVIRRDFANGDKWHYLYDAQGRPVRVTARNNRASTATALFWDDERLAAIRHPNENELRRYDGDGRLIEKRLQRRGALFPASTRFHEYIDRFEYDPRHRPVVHHLPEGGALHYSWNTHTRLMRIDWVDAQGRRHNVMQALADQPGYQYGNGLKLALAYRRGGARALAVYDGETAIWEHFREHDANDRLVRESNHFPTAALRHEWRYAYDGRARLIAAMSPATQHWYAWHNDGRAAAARHDKHTIKPNVERDASGLPRAINGFELSHGPHRRLTQVRRLGTVLADYRHNAFGHRIHARTPEDDTHYFYLDNRLVAESRRPRNGVRSPRSPAVTRRYIHAGHTLVAMIDYSEAQPDGVLYAVHTDLLGAPRLITDTAKRVRWLAEYTPLGSARRIVGDLRFNPRLPGQVADAATGWHDNLLRTYDPRFGHYLEPDPLGPLPGSQAWGYAAQQPRRYADPLGLLLFAFDGTRMNAHTRGNVWLLSQRYLDGPVFYHSGPGNPYYWDLDALAAHEAPQTIETQWQHLLNALHAAPVSAGQPVAIDILGYSRGAALARHFGNLIERHVDRGLFSYADPLRGQVSACVDLRFMGLFDTVAQFGLGGALNVQYDFSIASAWGWVAHAVALQERRSLFPLLAAGADAAGNVVEAPFVGAHADIGGGVPPGAAADPAHGDLSDVALNWMLWQAHAASVPLGRLAPDQAAVDNPILHDHRPSLARMLLDGDRRVDDPDGQTRHDRQDDHPRLGQQQRNATEALIRRYDDWHGSGSSEVGTVDLDAYARWLHDELGWQAAPLQATSEENHAII